MTSLVSEATKVLSSAEKEYASDSDRLSNFKAIDGVDPELVCFIYLTKHIDGIRNYVTGRARVQRDSIRGRILDAMNYLILLNAIIIEKESEGRGRTNDYPGMIHYSGDPQHGQITIPPPTGFNK